jgi:predicted dithiol-disulfide oxidoreductase (DUF899 family)
MRRKTKALPRIVSQKPWQAAHDKPLDLHARDTSFALVSRAPLANIQRYRKRMGWTVPWYSSHRSDFNVDFGLTTDEGETFGLSVLPARRPPGVSDLFHDRTRG